MRNRFQTDFKFFGCFSLGNSHPIGFPIAYLLEVGHLLAHYDWARATYSRPANPV